MRKFIVVTLIIILFVFVNLTVFSNQQKTQHTPVIIQGEIKPTMQYTKLGVGLGWKVYPLIEDWYELEEPFVYDWDADHEGLRFGWKYTPMLWGCSDNGLRKIINWPIKGDYVLFLNEPDNPDQSKCPPEKAIYYLKAILDNRPDLRVLVGGTTSFYVGYWWVETLGRVYYQKYGEYPDVYGLHIHIYPFSCRETEIWEDCYREALDQLDRWYQLVDRNGWLRGKPIWITETGILWNAQDSLVSAYMRAFLTYTCYQERIQRVYWFMYEGKTQGRSPWYFQATSLVWDGQRRPLWPVFQDVTAICKGAGM